MTAEDRSQRHLALAAYALHILGGPFTFGAATLAALIINYLQRGPARGTIYGSHHEWMITTCWTCALLALGLLLVGIWFPSVCSLLLPAVGIYMLLRMVTGFVAAAIGEPVRD